MLRSLVGSEMCIRDREEAERRATEGRYGRSGDKGYRNQRLKRKAMEDMLNKKRPRNRSVFDEELSEDEMDGVGGFRSGMTSGVHFDVGDMGGLFSYTKTKGVKKPARRVMPKGSKPGETKSSKKKDLGWSMEEDMALELAVREYGDNWKLVADMVAMHQRVIPRRRFSENECKDYYFERDFVREDGGKPPSSQSRTSYATAVLRSVQRCIGKHAPIIEIRQAENPQVRVQQPKPADPGAKPEGTKPAAKFVEALADMTETHDPLELIQLIQDSKPKQTPEQQQASAKHQLKHPMAARASSLMRSPAAPGARGKLDPAAATPDPATPKPGGARAGGKASASPTAVANRAAGSKPKAAAAKRGGRGKGDKGSPSGQPAGTQPRVAAQAPGAMAAPAAVLTPQQQAAATQQQAAAQQQQAAMAAAQQQAATAAAQQQAAQQQAAVAAQQAAAAALQQQPK
eukprot:TRINITY_DN8577_c0_g1_i1.p1 TRINITY_DN8577_c0_g1~~TRINITY_DN8577_c0_g1_i1.p1  ORF type:complete len:458 (+),score=157.56 TRINITY_DN8577_c0_g1_i1:137-1510(+)